MFLLTFSPSKFGQTQFRIYDYADDTKRLQKYEDILERLRKEGHPIFPDELITPFASGCPGSSEKLYRFLTH